MSEIFDQRYPDAQERRRYALLAAAAQIVRGLTFTELQARDIQKSVDAAEMLLAEIERREKAEGQ